MRRIIESAIMYGILKSNKERFAVAGEEVDESSGVKKERNLAIVKLMAYVISLIISYAILLWVGKWLWNNYLVPVTNFQKVTSLKQILAISILLKLMIN